jgi:hypothetical protein
MHHPEFFVAGAVSLQRIYGISFPDSNQLKEWQKMHFAIVDLICIITCRRGSVLHYVMVSGRQVKEMAIFSTSQNKTPSLIKANISTRD